VDVGLNVVCRLFNNRNTPPMPEVQPPLVVLPSFAVLPSESESETIFAFPSAPCESPKGCPAPTNTSSARDEWRRISLSSYPDK